MRLFEKKPTPSDEFLAWLLLLHHELHGVATRQRDKLEDRARTLHDDWPDRVVAELDDVINVLSGTIDVLKKNGHG